MLFAWLHRYPFLRLLCPFVAGIYCGDELIFQGQSGWVASCVFPLFFFSFGWMVISYFRKSYKSRWLFGISLFFFCFVLGAASMGQQLQSTDYSFPEKSTTYRMVLTEQPQVKERSMLCRVRLTEQIDSAFQKTDLNLTALVYLSRDSLSESLRRGDVLLVYTKFSSPMNSGNPDEFDYARFLRHHQVSAVGFVYRGAWKRISWDAARSFRQKALDHREQIMSIYHRLGFQGDDFAVLSALTVGYKEELSEDIRESYSVSGVSHVLALSGLHIGFLYALLWFGLRRLPGRWQVAVLLRTVLILLCLWAFAFFTGLSASVVRSVIMFSLFALSGLVRRKNFSLNTLFAAAFFMLLVRPSYLFDVGFQLSVSAVAAILLLQPSIYRWFPDTPSRVGHYLRGLISVSIAAQIGTAPLVLYYFSRFSIYFLLSNLLIIPLVSVVMYAAVVMLLLTPFFPLQAVTAVVVKGLIEALNASVRWVEKLPYASLDGIYLYRWDIAGIYLVLFLLGGYFFFRKRRSLFLGLICLLLVCTYHAVMQTIDRPRQSIEFYNVRNCPVVHCIAASGRSWLVYADSIPDETRLRKALSKHWNRLHLHHLHAVAKDYAEAPFICRNSILSFSGQRVGFINNNNWQNKQAPQPLFIDHLYLCKGFEGRLAELMKVFSFRDVILDASLTEYRRQAYERECKELGIPFISLSQQGSARFLL